MMERVSDIFLKLRRNTLAHLVSSIGHIHFSNTLSDEYKNVCLNNPVVIAFPHFAKIDGLIVGSAIHKAGLTRNRLVVEPVGIHQATGTLKKLAKIAEAKIAPVYTANSRGDIQLTEDEISEMYSQYEKLISLAYSSNGVIPISYQGGRHHNVGTRQFGNRGGPIDRLIDIAIKSEFDLNNIVILPVGLGLAINNRPAQSSEYEKATKSSSLKPKNSKYDITFGEPITFQEVSVIAKEARITPNDVIELLMSDLVPDEYKSP